MKLAEKSILVPILIGFITICLFFWVSYNLGSVLIFIPGVIISFLVYLKTFYQRTPKPGRILTLYLLAIGVQLLHFTEEYLTDFITRLPALLDQPPYPQDYWVVFNMVAYFIFILGGIILYRGIKELMIIPLFFVVVGVVLNSIGHILIAIFVGGYFPGLFTAIIYLLIGPSLLKAIIEKTKMVGE